MSHRTPAEVFPPGEFLKEELDARGWTQSEFAEIIGRDCATVNRVISGKAQVTPEMACLLEDALGLDAAYWLNLESAYQLGKLRLTQQHDRLVTLRVKLYEKFPIKAMISRGWIVPSENAEVLSHRVRGFFRISDLDDEPMLPHAAKKRVDLKRTPNQNAWLFRTLQLAETVQAQPFCKSKLNAALEQLRKLLEDPGEICRVPAILSEAGVRFIVVEPLKSSRIDGACYWIDSKSPVVALSLLHPSIDCFWFDLVHELMHVAHGDGKSEPVIDDGDEGADDRDEIERAANADAEGWLIPSAGFDGFVRRHGPGIKRRDIVAFAREVRVHPGIVAGRLHKKGVIRDWALYGRLKINVRETVTSSAVCDGWGKSSQN